MNRRFIIYFVLWMLSFPIGLHANGIYRDSVYAVGGQIGYGYNQTYHSYGILTVDAYLPINHYFEAEVNMRASTANTYMVGVRMQPKFPLPYGEFYLRTHLQYDLLLRNRFHGLVGMFGVGYRFDYLNLMVGYGSRVTATIDMSPEQTEHGISEPHNLVYHVEVMTRPHSCRWNLSVFVTNMTDYQMERMFTPMCGLRSNVDITPEWRLRMQGIVKPVGISNLAPSFYGAEMMVGVMYRINKTKK